jgi:aerobic-type carbon monoxide dehydrogenase small subunit (CoxS/CutS family)
MNREKCFRLVVNGSERLLERDPERSLLVALREELHLTGAKYACGEGACGACTVLVDGAPVRACVTRLGDAAGRSVVTVEGLARGAELHPVQRAFVDAGAVQCGYCTPGMIVNAVALLARNPDPSDAQIREAMDGNLCRCCAYARITRAIHEAAAALRGRP